jgi:hypothetical protein
MRRVNKNRRAVALILALFTTVILSLLSIAFVALSRTEARNSASAAHEKLALESANYALELAINYMGQGKVSLTENTWQRVPHPSTFRFVNILAVTGGARSYLDRRIVVELPDTATKAKYGAGDTFIQDNMRVFRMVDASGTNTLPIQSGTQAFSSRVVIVPVTSFSDDNSYRLFASAKVFPDTTAAATDLNPLASREIEAQLTPESVFSYLHFIENARGLVAPGRAQFDPNTFDQNGAVVIDPADFAVIPADYTEDGPMRVDGHDPSFSTSSDPGKVKWLANSGNLNFSSDALPSDQGGKVFFREKLTINRSANDYQNGDVDDTNSGYFQGGFNTSNPHLGLPELDMDTMRRGAKYTDAARGKSSAFFEVKTSEIPGARGSTVAAPRNSGDPFYTLNSSGVRVPYDYRPRIPNVEVTFDGDKVRLQKTSTLNGDVLPINNPQDNNSVTPAAIELKVDDFATGVLFVDGGNVVVNNAPSMSGTEAKFNKRISVVAGTGEKRGSASPGLDTIYTGAASKVYEYEKKRWDIALQNDPNAQPTGFLTPPYTRAQIDNVVAYAQTHPLTPRATAQDPNPPTFNLSLTAAERAEYQALANSHPTWPAPPTGVEREGNLVVGGDITAEKNSSSKIGLFAENFVTINGNPKDLDDKELIIDAALMSKNKTVTLDWDNIARLDADRWKTLMSTDFKGKLTLTGSIVGSFIDIEGDNEGRGYTRQNFTHNPFLREERPPFTPVWDFSMLPGGFRFVVTHYTDRGSINTNKAL